MYKELSEQMISKFNINIVQQSTCWSRMHAHCDGTRRICKWIPAESYRSLYDLLHEIGHIETNKAGMKRCEQESEATLWANAHIKELGLPLKRKIINKFKKYIRRTYDRGIRRGLSKRIKSKLYF